MKRYKVFFWAALAIYIFFPPLPILAETCCKRFIQLQTAAPGSIAAFNVRSINSSVRKGFSYKGAQEEDCPIMVEWSPGYQPHYLVDCEVKVLPSDIKGQYFTFYAKLIDPNHGNAVLAGPEHVSWHGHVKDHFINKPTGGTRDLIVELIQHLRPFDDKIEAYERIPESCTIEPEKDEIEGGETITINLNNIQNAKGRTPKPWQRLVVKVDIGKIKNGVNKHPEYIFKVGGGSVAVQYEAPEKCDFDTENITVSNSCETKGPLSATVEHKQIASKEIKVDDFRPIKCSVEAKKKKLNPGEATTIRLSDFVELEGRDLRPEEKIMVKAKEGQITNGKPHGDYRIFTIGDGTVKVAYQAPEICGVDKDSVTVHNVCENEKTGVIEPKKEIAKKEMQVKKVSCDLSVNIRAAFQWQGKGAQRSEGNAQFQIRGEMKFDKRYQLPMVKRYIPGKMRVSFRYKGKTVDMDVDPKCPQLISEYMGGGSGAMPDPRLKESTFLEIRRFGNLFPKDMPINIPAEAKDHMKDQFELVLPGIEQIIRGKIRKGSSCSKDECPCREYSAKEKKIGVGSVVIRGKIDKNGRMRGNHAWTAQGSAMRSLGLQVNDVGKEPDYRPRPLKVVGDELTSVSVSWDLKANR